LTTCVPTLLLIETEVALLVAQLRVEELPAVIALGVALKLEMMGAAAFTVTVTVAVVVPPGPVAVSV